MVSITEADLLACIEALPPVTLVGLSLVRQPPTEEEAQQGHWFPSGMPPAQLIAATLEIIAYTDRCRNIARKVADVRPIACTFSVVEYPL